MSSENDVRIKTYLDETMDEQQREDFEQACLHDAALLLALKREIKVRLAAKIMAQKQRRAFYQKAEEPGNTPVFKIPVHTSRLLKMAATVILVATIGLTGYLTYHNLYGPSPHNVFNHYFQPYTLSSTRSPDDDSIANNRWPQAMQAYQKQEWHEAKTLLRELLKQGSFNQSDLARLMLANACLAQDSARMALQILNETDRNNVLLKHDIAWYQALAFLQAGHTERAKELLINLESSKVYGERAKAIQQELF